MKFTVVALFFCGITCALAQTGQQIPNQKFKKQTIDSALWTPNPALKKVLIQGSFKYCCSFLWVTCPDCLCLLIQM
jgi:hypothetical protein